ncbi:DUF4328 domain-containing protein [Pedobacter psychrodurus]|uniref:DUF4328 domain-containing protein n=1 Tax=Pedobacter psychrodurus TaxID=2530456 RepID=A0A4V2MQW9_9SPHI|nr:DUF4328 domain-containing protein [Pedobacter psychrodurus]TCD26739.1 DUF4328 domain-containing protein [Pedobacter psychrodurus]
MNLIRPNEKRAKIAIIMIWIVLTLEIISFFSSYLQYDLLKTVSSGSSISNSEINANDIRERIIAILYFGVYLTSCITFIRWFRRAYFNLQLKTDYLSSSDNWAALSWFIPFICLYKPYQIMKEMYTKTNEILFEETNQTKAITTSYLGWWWGLWIISNIIGQVVFRTTLNSDNIDSLTNGTIASMVGNLIGLPLSLITVKVIKDYSDIENLLIEVKGDKIIISTENTYLNPEF